MKSIVSPPSRAQQAYTAIRDSIIEGKLAPGAHLVQEELAGQLGVSRQPIQQAMALLKSDGLVVETGARGLHVAPLSATATSHRYQVRAALEQLAARLAAERAARAPDFAERLLREGEDMLAAGDEMMAQGRHREAVDHDIAFHMLLYRATGNPLLAPSAETHLLYCRRVMIAVLEFSDRGPVVWAQHRDILSAICSGRVEEAGALMTGHIYGSERAFTEALRRMNTDHSSIQH